MAAPEVVAGVALLYPGTGPSHDGGRTHIQIVVGVNSDKGDVCLVPVCSAKTGSDKTCELDQSAPVLGLVRKSYIGYYSGKMVGLKSLVLKITNQEVTYIGKLPGALYAVVRSGVDASPETEPWFKKAVQNCK